jgi:hypothetical protein
MMIEIRKNIVASVDCCDTIEAMVRSSLEKYPMIEDAILCHSLSGSRNRIFGSSVRDVGALIDRVNPRYPGDSCSVPTITALLSGEAHLDVEEVDIAERSLPDYGKDQRIGVSASKDRVTVTFQRSIEGMVFEVRFSGEAGLNYPVEVTLRTWLDMDDLRNHWEPEWNSIGCPERNQSWECPACKEVCKNLDPVYVDKKGTLFCYHCDKEFRCIDIEWYEDGDCNCQADVAYEGSIIIEDNFSKEKVMAWIEDHLFEGQQTEKSNA